MSVRSSTAPRRRRVVTRARWACTGRPVHGRPVHAGSCTAVPCTHVCTRPVAVCTNALTGPVAGSAVPAGQPLLHELAVRVGATDRSAVRRRVARASSSALSVPSSGSSDTSISPRRRSPSRISSTRACTAPPRAEAGTSRPASRAAAARACRPGESMPSGGHHRARGTRRALPSFGRHRGTRRQHGASRCPVSPVRGPSVRRLRRCRGVVRGVPPRRRRLAAVLGGPQVVDRVRRVQIRLRLLQRRLRVGARVGVLRVSPCIRGTRSPLMITFRERVATQRH